MEALVSDLTKKPYKNWKNLFQIFLDEPVFRFAEQREDGLSYFLLGLSYELGSTVQKDYYIALQYYLAGVNKRDPLCLYKLYEIYSGNNYYGVQPDRDVAFMYLVWAVTYMFPMFGSYMCLDLDLELQSYYKNTLKLDKERVLRAFEEYDDDIFAHDKDLIKCVFEFLIEFITPGPQFDVQQGYEKMVDSLIDIAEKGDPRLAAMFLFKCVLWDFKGVTDRKHRKILDLIRRKKCVSFIYEQIKAVFDYITLLNKRHTIFSRLLHFHSIEIFLQIKYNSDPDDVVNKEEACDYLINFLYNNLPLLDNNYTRSMAICLMAKRYMNKECAQKKLSLALNVLESSRQLPGFVEQDFPFVLGGRLYSKLGDNIASEKYYEKFMGYSDSKSNLPMKFYEQGKYYQYCKRDNTKAIEAYTKGLESALDTNTFLQECYVRKCRTKIAKMIQSNEGLVSNKIDSSSLEKVRAL